MNRLTFIAVLFCAHLGVSLYSNAEVKHHCDMPCPDGKSGTYYHIRGDEISDAGDGKNSICTKDVNKNLVGFETVKIGWGDSCRIPAGYTTPSATSPITTNNMIGEVIDTLTTVGVGIEMRKSFCSFMPGEVGNGGFLEGAIVKSDFLIGCSTQKCIKCRLLGRADDCKDGPNIKDEMLTNNPCDGIPNLEKPLFDDAGKMVFDGKKQVFCPLLRANIPTTDIKVMYFNSAAHIVEIVSSITAAVAAAVAGETAGIGSAVVGVVGLGMDIAAAAYGDACEVRSLVDGSGEIGVGFMNTVKLKGEKQGDRICAKMLFPTGYTTMACKPTVAPITTFPEPNQCLMKHAPACMGGQSESKWVLPFTSRMMQCVNDLIDTMFTPIENEFPSSTTSGQVVEPTGCLGNSLFAFQDNMKNIVQILLVLYVIIFGLNIVMGGEMPKKAEFFIFIMKFAAVVYFSVGTLEVERVKPRGAPSTIQSIVGGVSAFDNQETQLIKKNGLVFIKDAAFSAMYSFANMMITAGVSSNGACDFSGEKYKPGYTYLQLWDSLDCKLAYYIGLASPTEEGSKMFDTGTSSLVRGAASAGGGVLKIVWVALFSFEILLMVFLLAFTVFLFSIVIYFVHIYIIAMFAVTIMLFFGPLFVPMLLFEKTKGYFDSWWQLLLGYTLQPVIITAFIAVVITTFDLIVFTGCAFTKTHVGTPPAAYWKLDENKCDVNDANSQGCVCQKSFGYLLSQLTPASAMHRVAFGSSDDNSGGMFYYYKFLKDFPTTSVDMIESLMICAFFVFLFYHFAEQLSNFAADLSNSQSLGDQAIKPNAITDGIGGLAKDVAGAIKDRIKGGGGGSGSSGSGINVSESTTNRQGISVAASAPSPSAAPAPAAAPAKPQARSNSSGASDNSGASSSSSKSSGASSRQEPKSNSSEESDADEHPLK